MSRRSSCRPDCQRLEEHVGARNCATRQGCPRPVVMAESPMSAEQSKDRVVRVGGGAPSVADLLQGWGEWLAFTDHQGGRYTDPGLQAATRAGEIDRTALQNLRKLMLECIDTNQNLDNYLAAFMSRFRLAHDPMSPPATITTKELLNALSGETRLHRNPWTRLTWIESTEGARLYAAGQSYDCSIQLAESLCQYEQPRIRAGMLDQASLELLTRLVNNGHFLLTGED